MTLWGPKKPKEPEAETDRDLGNEDITSSLLKLGTILLIKRPKENFWPFAAMI